MRELYKKAVVLLAVLLSSTMVHSQCEEITIESLSNPGIYNVATLTEADGLRNGPDYFGATVYYPTNGTPPYASIAIVPGFTASPESVEAWGPFYASHGIVTIIIGTNSIYDFPEARAEALLDALETLVGFPETNYISSPKARKRISEGTLVDVGKSQQLNVERILELNPDLLLSYGVESIDGSLKRFNEMGIPSIFIGEWNEQNPLGRAEWLKVFGALLGTKREIWRDYYEAIA